MFSLFEQSATLSHLSMYKESHGEDVVKGVALKLSLQMPATVLEQFDPHLFHTVYRSSAMNLKFPDMGPISWKRELVGATIELDSEDLLGQRRVYFELATVDKFIITALEGGSVDITLRIKIKPDARAMSTLYEMLNGEVKLTIDPAKAEDQPAKDEKQAEIEGVED